MSQARKMLKIISFIQVILTVAAVVTGIMLVVSASDAQTSAFGLDPVTHAMLGGLVILASGIAAFMAAVQGIKGANVPSRLGAHGPASAVSLLFAAAGIALDMPAGIVTASVVALLLLCASVAALLVGNRVRKEQDR